MRYSIVFKLIFAIICLLTVASLFSAGLHTHLSGMIVYDYNFQAMHETLSREQAAGIVRTVRNLTAWSTWPLFASNLCWIALFIFCHARDIRPNDRNA